VFVEEHGKAIIVLEKRIATMIPDDFRPEVLSEDPVARAAGEAERPEHGVVVYEASQVLKQFFDVSKPPRWTVHGRSSAVKERLRGEKSRIKYTIQTKLSNAMLSGALPGRAHLSTRRDNVFLFYCIQLFMSSVR
jgi:hypothetical protein